ncbi:MAG: hypothetical protein ACE5OR_07105 [bacterium]
MKKASKLKAAPRIVTDEAGNAVEVILSIEDYNLFLEMLEDVNLSKLLLDRKDEPSRPVTEFFRELDKEGEKTERGSTSLPSAYPSLG